MNNANTYTSIMSKLSLLLLMIFSTLTFFDSLCRGDRPRSPEIQELQPIGYKKLQKSDKMVDIATDTC